MSKFEALHVSVTDQFKAFVKHLVKETQEHLKYCPQPDLACPGTHVEGALLVQNLDQLRILVEVALVDLAQLQTAYDQLKAAHTNMTANAVNLAEEVVQANIKPKHWCSDCGVPHA